MKELLSNHQGEHQSRHLWEKYLQQVKDKTEAPESKILETFWEEYANLIQQTKASMVNQPPKVAKAIPELNFTHLFHKYWEQPFKLSDYQKFQASHTPQIQKKQAQGIVLFIMMANLLGLGLIISFTVHNILGMLLLFFGIIVILAKALITDSTAIQTRILTNIQNKVIIKPIECSLDTHQLIYKTYSIHRNEYIEVLVPYQDICSLWDDQRGLVVVGENDKALWYDKQAIAAHEVILPNLHRVRAFLNDVVIYNYQLANL